MKKRFFALVALFAAMTIALPAFAAVELQYGGQFRTRMIAQDNLFDGVDADARTFIPGLGQLNTSAADDKNFFIDQRLRMYFTFKASENLRVVTRLEVGDSVWGNVNDPKGVRVGADMVGVELKNAYVDFAIPGCPGVRSMIGTQGINLLNSWIVDDDFAAAVVQTKFDPIRVSGGYIAAQNIPDGVTFSGQEDSIDDLYLNVEYVGDKSFPLSASLVLFWQYGHDTAVSVEPRTLTTPQPQPAAAFDALGANIGNTVAASTISPGQAFFMPVGGLFNSSPPSPQFRTGGVFAGSTVTPAVPTLTAIRDNSLFDIGINLGWKADVWNAYLSFVKNLGGFDARQVNAVGPLGVTPITTVKEFDYTGWMLDLGFNYFCGPWTFNLGFFWTSGQEDNVNQLATDEIQFFTYPLATSKYFSEIMGGGIFDNDAPVHTTPRVSGATVAAQRDFQWRGYGFPSNIWTITLGGSWQVLEKTKLSASYWYFGTAEDVNSGFRFDPIAGVTRFTTDDSIGHELNFYLTQGIVDGLTLDVVAAYMFADDALTGFNADDDIYELGARLQWNF